MFWPFTVQINCYSDVKKLAISRPSASNFKSFSRSLEQFFLTVGQNNFGNKIPLINYPDHRYWRRERSHKRGCLTQWYIQQVSFKCYYGKKQGWNYANSFSESASKLQIVEWQQIPLQHHSFPERRRIFVRVSIFQNLGTFLFLLTFSVGF